MKNRISTLFLLVCWLFSTHTTDAQSLLHYWHFNDNSTVDALLTPSVSVVGSPTIAHISGGISAIALNGTGQNFDVLNLNARNGDPAGTHLRFNDPLGGEIQFDLPTTGYEDILIQFATRRSGSGAGLQYWAYSVDAGVNYIPFDTIAPNDGDPLLETFDFSGIAAVNDNPDFILKVSFDIGSGGTAGNNRFDNFTVEGEIIPPVSLIHYWNFNDISTIEALLAPNYSAVNTPAIMHVPGGISEIVLTGTGQNFDVLNLNARNGDPAGTHLRFNDPIGGEIEFALPTTGFKDILVQFATRRSGSGAGLQYWAYSADGGINYVPFDTIAPNNGDPLLDGFDFADITAADDNPEFMLKVSFDIGNGGMVGNNRFDNFTVEGIPLGGDILPPSVSFSPLNNSTLIPVDIQPTLSFNEPIRLINDAAIDNSNAASLVELRQNDANGALVPFTATYGNQILTIIPDTDLANSQTYYVALLADAIEDLNNNALSTLSSAIFTTIAIQTEFLPGDLVVVGYRMNATSTEDELALLTFVDILPGTLIRLTDAKVTTNPQPQCPGGLVWTSPSSCIPGGTIIYIQTDAGAASVGTLTGASFGMSSGGDQAMVYTGTPADPQYITALTSIDWITDNTSCSGSLSNIPAGLQDGITSLNTSSAPGNVAGLSVNAYYNGTQMGSVPDLRTSILDPANWIVAGAGTPAQTWPTWNFPGPPAVTNARTISQSSIQLIFNADLDPVSANNPANYSGIPGLDQVTVSDNGSLSDTVVLTYSLPFVPSVAYTLMVQNISNVTGNTMSCPYAFDFSYNTTLSWASNFVVVEEDHGFLELILQLENPATSSIELQVEGAPYSTADTDDFILFSQILSFTGQTNGQQLISIPIQDDQLDEQSAEYFVLRLINPTDCSVNGDATVTVYIRDNDRQVPSPAKDIELIYVGSFDPSGSNNSSCEVVVYDPASQRLLTTSALTQVLDIIDFSVPTNPTVLSSFDFTPLGGITSVSVSNGIVAVASPNTIETEPGSVVFLDIDGNYLTQLTVGALPDMVTFTPDGKKVILANEGQPNDPYTIDPEGSISIVDISGGILFLTQANVTTLDFTAWNAQEANLLAAGVRKLYSGSTLSQDLEPEYITVRGDSKLAWVTLQENNAIAEIDLETNTITNLWPMGTKDFGAVGNGFDASDNNQEILIANWPVNAFFIPDAIANYTVNGTTYLVTANEGDEKEYAGLVERTTVGNAGYVLDSVAFPHADILKKSYNLGRMRVTNLHGDTDGDGDFDQIHCVGSRSFSIWNAETGALVYDSGDDFEFYLANDPVYKSIFNADNENNALKGRSRAKGPEPEGVAIGRLGNGVYAFVTLERIGGVMVYDVTQPNNPRFMHYQNNRSTTAFEGDHAPEGIIVIPAADSPTGKPMVVVANEISGTLTIYSIKDNINSLNDPAIDPASLTIFPNPTTPGMVTLNQVTDVVVMDLNGRPVVAAQQAQKLDVSALKAGTYIVKSADGKAGKLVIME
ncbi:MAG: choice-of-anchor I family protein [Saprospiraceae bacterium]|nr:choice-of-anchor I family protein [Saprospiraceae bacterium]